MRIINTASHTALAIVLGFDADEPQSGGDTTTTEAPAESGEGETAKKDEEPKTVLNHMKSRAVFDSTDAAFAYLERMATECTDWADEDGNATYPGLTVGLTEDGALDPEIYTDDMQITVARLTEKGKRGADGKMEKETRVIAIVVYPTPKLAAVMANAENGQPWLQSLIEKEANLIAMRALRRDEDLANGVDAMPKTLADYWTPASAGGSSILATYNEVWQAVRDATGAKIPALKQAGLSKKVFRNCLESASFAQDSYARLESRKNKAGQEYSAFVYALHIGKTLAEEEGLDPAFFVNALATRDDKVIALTDTGEDDIDLDILTGDEEGEEGAGE